MHCLHDSQLVRIIAGECVADEEIVWTEHLSECLECQESLERLCGGKDSISERWEQSKQALEFSKLSAQSKQSLYDLAKLPSPESPSSQSSTVPRDSGISHLITVAETPQELSRFDDYLVLKVLGRGGMAIVVQAIEPVLERIVAIKILLPHLASDQTARARFLSEAKAIAKIDHPNVLGIHRVAEYRETPYLVMPCVNGSTIAELIENRGRFSAQRTVEIGIQVCDALDAAHGAGIIHRDIKPGNLLIDAESGCVKVSDFGLARAATVPSLTQTGYIAGTPQYMSSEQAMGKTLDARTDIYSLGAVMYTMLAGQPPFTGEHPISVVHQVVHDTAKPLNTIDTQDASLPSWLIDLIENAMSKDRELRPPSAAAFRRCLEQQTPHVGNDSQALVAKSGASPLFGTPKQLMAVTALILVLTGAWFGSRRAMRYLSETPKASTATVIEGTSKDGAQTGGRILVRSRSGSTKSYSSIGQALTESAEGASVTLPPDRVYQLSEETLQQIGKQTIDLEIRMEAGTLGVDSGLQIQSTRSWQISDGSKVKLVGLKIDRADEYLAKANSTDNEPLLDVQQGKLSIEACQIQQHGHGVVVQTGGELSITRSIVLAFDSVALTMQASADTSVMIKDSLFVGRWSFSVLGVNGVGGNLQLHDSTFCADQLLHLHTEIPRHPLVEPLRIDARGNVFQVQFLNVVDGIKFGGIATREKRARAQLQNHVQWRGDSNLYAISRAYYGLVLADDNRIIGRRGKMRLAEWREFCAAEGESSAEAATTVLATVPSSDLDASNFSPSDFALEASRSASEFGADIKTLGIASKHEE